MLNGEVEKNSSVSGRHLLSLIYTHTTLKLGSVDPVDPLRFGCWFLVALVRDDGSQHR